jgi:two-component system NtrC family sensor kinase
VRLELGKRIFLIFVLVITVFCMLGALLGATLINRNILNEAQRRISLDLRSGWSLIQGEVERMRLFVNLLGSDARVASVANAAPTQALQAFLENERTRFGCDFLSLTDATGRVILRTVEPYRKNDYLANDPIIAKALEGNIPGGFAILGPQRLHAEGDTLEEKAFIVFESTPKAKQRAKTAESSGMALVAAAPIKDPRGKIAGVIYAGILLNRNHALVDRIRSVVFEDKIYNGRHIGTVTIFQWDTRIATNVIRENGNRAIGTRVSQDVYDKVLENDSHWYDRAFVVNDWYISAYDPIHDTAGNVIGILYVGVLAKTYDDMKQALWKLYGGLAAALAAVVLAVGFIFARRVTGSLRQLARAAEQIARGIADTRVPEPVHNDEILDLTKTFNTMAASLRDREERLKQAYAELENTNTSLHKINTSYLDMLGFVSHELKNTLGVIYTSARTLHTGLVGALSEPQARLVGNITRSISTAVAMTRSYLDLARIESGALHPVVIETDLLNDIILPVLDELHQLVAEKEMIVEKAVPQTLAIMSDPNLLQIVYRNLISNALKYGRRQGRIKLGAVREETDFRFEVFNEGDGLSPDKIGRLFGKFVRFNHEKDAARSAGLGLFITRQIIAAHGGRIWVESEAGRWINFIFSLPVNPAAFNQHGKPDPPPLPAVSSAS